jgi:hypothetical protein
MLHHYPKMTSKLEKILEDDPVRPHIPYYMRLNRNRYITGFGDSDAPGAVVCYSIVDYVPKIECELFYDDNEKYDVACLYTIWSNKKGDARRLVFDMLPYLKNTIGVKRIVTLSPTTDMAKRFHINNGAVVYRENLMEGTVNYEYLL